MRRSATAADLEGKLHDLRRSFQTGLVRIGVRRTLRTAARRPSKRASARSIIEIPTREKMAAAWERWSGHIEKLAEARRVT